MRACFLLILAPVWLFVAAGCGSSGGSNNTSDTGSMRIVNLIPDSSTLSATLGSTAFSKVSYAQSTALTSLIPGDFTLTVSYTQPDGTVVKIVDDESLTISANEQTTVFLIGPIESMTMKVVTQSDPDISAASAEVWMMNAATGPASLDFYLGDASATIDSDTPKWTLDFGDHSDLSTIDAAASYRLRVTSAGTKDVIFDSGAFPISALTRRLFVACDYFGPGGNGTYVVQVDTVSASTFTLEVLPSGLRLANMIANETAVDLYLDGATTPSIENLQYGAVSSFLQLPSANVNATVTLASDPATVLYTGTLNLSAGEYRTLVVARSSSDKVVARNTVESLRSIADVSSVDVVQASAAAGDVDMYFLVPGQPLSDLPPVFSGLSFLESGAMGSTPGIYDVEVTPTDEETVSSGPERIALAGGGSYTVILTDAPGGGLPSQIIFTDNLAN